MLVDETRQAEVALIALLIKALRALGDAGSTEQASRLAADAWCVLRRQKHPSAERFTGLLHYLARPAQPTYKRKDNDHMADTVLDVRDEVPARRHDLIFATYQGLQRGDGFILVNDHDPKPLYYQFAAEHHGEFGWTYLEQGPEVWRVRIGRN